MFRRSDELVSNYQIKGTALDCSNNGELLAVAGANMINVIGLHSSGVSHLREKYPFQIVNVLKFHPKYTFYCAAAVSNVHFFSETQLFNQIPQNGKITDVDFSPFDESLLCCSTSNALVLWDLRETKYPALRFSTVFGAQQAKFNPLFENQIISTHGTDIRFYDTRFTCAPRKQMSAHEQTIVALALNPTRPNVLITSGAEDSFKVWSRFDDCEGPQALCLPHARVGKVKYSPSGDEFVSISIPEQVGESNTLKLWKAPTYENPEELRKGVNDTYADACWHKGAATPFKYLFTLGKGSRLLRNPIVGTNIHNTTNEMPVPIVQSAEDRKRDKQLLGSSERRNPGDYSSDRTDSATEEPSMSHRTPSWSLFTDPKEWSGWVRAPNLTGGDLLTELESLRKLNTLGLSTNEINFPRAAVGLSYAHRGRCEKIVIEMRFHKQFLENGWIFIEIIQKDCPIDAHQARQLLLAIQEESKKQATSPGPATVMARVLQQLPLIVDQMNVFTGSIDIPSTHTTINSTDSSVTEETGAEHSELGIRLFPISYFPTPHDQLVPAPRVCGARFNRNGILCMFGRLERIPFYGVSVELTYPKITEKPKLDTKKATMKRLSDVSKSSAPKGWDRKLARSGSTRSQYLLKNGSDGNARHPRSLAEYYQCVTPEHVAYIHQLAERAASARRAGHLAGMEVSDRLSFSAASPLNSSQVHPALEVARHAKVGSSRVLAASPVHSLGTVAHRNASLHSNPVRRRVSSMSAGIVTEDGHQTFEPQFSTSVLVLDGSCFQGLSRTLAKRYTLIGGSASEICYHNLFAVVKLVPDRADLISLWQILYEFMHSSEEKEIQLYLRNEIESDFIGAEILPFDHSRVNEVECELYNRERLQLCALEYLAPDPYSSRIGGHPCGKEFISWFVEHYYCRYDVQTAAMVTCLLNEFVRRSGQMLTGQERKRDSRRSSQKASLSEDSANNSFSTLVHSRLAQAGGRRRTRWEKYQARQLKLCPIFVSSDEMDRIDMDEVRDYFTRSEWPAKSSRQELKHTDLSLQLRNQRAEIRSSYDPTTETMVDDGNDEENTTMPTVMRLEFGDEYELDMLTCDMWLEEKFDKIRDEYAILLSRWGLLNQKTELNKYSLRPKRDPVIMQVMRCARCGVTCDESPICPECEMAAVSCSVCDEPCEGLLALCASCGHGGHPRHLTHWFNNFDTCPMMCGCRCRF